MSFIVSEFETTEPDSPDVYGDGGCRIGALRRCAIAVRHEHFPSTLEQTIYLFARAPELGAQIFISNFPIPEGVQEYDEKFALFATQRKDFRIHGFKGFDTSLLCPNTVGFDQLRRSLRGLK